MAPRASLLDTVSAVPAPRPAREERGRITVISASVGAGHDGAADQLARRLLEQGWAVDRLDFLDLLPARLGRLVSGAYHRLLTVAPWSYQRIYASTDRARRPGRLARAFLRTAERRTLRALPAGTRAVVSTYPGASQVLGRLRRTGRLAVPALTYLTDLSVHPLWVAPGIDLHLAAHDIPAAQARALGAEHVAVCGPVVDPRFNPATTQQRHEARSRFGLPDRATLALLVAGSWGVGEVARVAAEVRDSGAAVPVVVCGRNQALADRLRDQGIEHAFGWVSDMPGLMHACDVLVQNAGGLTSLEALACGLPVASYRCIPGHGQTNAAALQQAGLAPWIREPARLGAVLRDLAGGPAGQRNRQAGLALHQQANGPTRAIEHAAAAGLAAASPAAASVSRRPRRKLAFTAAALAAATWLSTGGTELAVAYGGFDTLSTSRADRSFLVVHPPRGHRLDDATIRDLVAAHAAVAIDATQAAADPAEIRHLASAGLTLVNAGYGTPYATGILTRRGSLAAGADALHAATGKVPGYFLSSTDVDAVDLALAAYHREHLVVPTTRLACTTAPGSTALGQVILLECGTGQPAALDAALRRLLHTLSPGTLTALAQGKDR
ncbi:glycosyltransferase [Streptacidiphilus carbonis]|uniref:glycosyltransferase n=1 Tax=Streptacidiphilus carbonis TaxID=105422 RepID=UPI000B2D8C32|nr:glycosyltransferase [Streptacidiphilus carbonis]